MMRTVIGRRLTIGWLGAALAGITTSGAAAPNLPEPPVDPNPGAKTPMVDPSTIWPVSLSRIVGKYHYVQVASPGGLWENSYPKGGGGGGGSRQVSINEVPTALREKLTHAEIELSDLKQPATIEASERTSPSGRGKLRYYDETADGRLHIRNLPGASGEDADRGEFNGPVTFTLSHRSHSNPSPSGIFLNRLQQEPTWGAAAIDYADLAAMADPLKPVKPENGAKPGNGEKPANPEKPGAAEKRAGAPNEEVEGRAVMENVRVLRSGMELVAYVEWHTTKGTTEYSYRGSIRLMRVDPAAGQGAAAIRPALRPSVGVPIRPSAQPQP